MPSTSGKDLKEILKEIKSKPELSDVNSLPRDTAKSEEFKKSIDCIQKTLEDTTIDHDLREKLNLEPNAHKNRSALRSRSNVEDLSKKRKKLLEQIHRLNQLENEKQIKILEQKRDLCVEKMKMQDSYMIQESLDSYYRNSREHSMYSFNSNHYDPDSDDDHLPFSRLSTNHPLVPVYIQDTRNLLCVNNYN